MTDTNLKSKTSETRENDKADKETRENHNVDDGSKFQDHKIECEEINGRSIGKAIIKYCGHEGTENDRNTRYLRRLLQAVISHIEKEHPDTWKNAEIRIYDYNFEIYSIKAGHGKHMFMVSLDENDEPKVIKTKPSIVNSKTEHQRCILM
ncbi:uncharacterized protein LOC132730828 [Ruditapes philippinarum]|uniref:uncharacterized protein LOC132730828 n=1 Tax=Ruditapes philippinarum TaxID=129788 RepID=UPI00295C098D|nr:uncharacterized protein LOC132730828 [Ruditapes philippinarum]